MIQPGQRVKLTEVTPDAIADGLTLGMIGIVSMTKGGRLGVRFPGQRVTGHPISISTRRADGTIISILSLCRPVESEA